MIVCGCNRITEAEVRKAARAGAPNPATAYAFRGCQVQCGCCLDLRAGHHRRRTVARPLLRKV